MNKQIAILVRAGFFGGLVALCSGCPDPNIYGGPRTTPVGKVSHTVALQAANYRIDNTKQPNGGVASASGPLLPTYLLRVGVVDKLDVGLRVAQLSSIGADIKWNFLKTDAFDMALDPGFQLFLYSSSSSSSSSYTEVYGSAPLLFGINVADFMAIVPTVGILYGKSSTTAGDLGTLQADAANINGLMFRGGFGLDFRLNPKFGMHPEVTYLKSLGSGSPSISWVVFGLGLSFGALPDMGGGGGEPAEK